MSYYLEIAGGLRVRVRVQPRASRSGLDGIVADQLRVRLTAPPVDNAANAACLEFLAALCGVARSRVQLVGGQKSRDKTFEISGPAPELLARIEAALGR